MSACTAGCPKTRKKMSETEPNRLIVEARHLVREVEGPTGKLTILDDVSLEVARGESVAITGPSGSGKSTLVALLAGLDVPTAGDVVLAGEYLNRLDEDGRAQLRSGRVGFVFQAFYLMETLTARENVMLPLEIAGRKDAAQIAADWLDRVGLADRQDHYPRQLSGGEQQRVAISRAFAIEPQILFADEPTGNLDDKSSQHIAELLFSLCDSRQAALILVTHDSALAARCQSRIALAGGRLVGAS